MLNLSLQQADPRHRSVLSRPFVRRCLAAAISEPAEITVRVVDAVEGRALNLDFRGKDYATNVLTFDYSSASPVLADLVLCAPVVEREARAQGLRLVRLGRSVEAERAAARVCRQQAEPAEGPVEQAVAVDWRVAGRA